MSTKKPTKAERDLAELRAFAQEVITAYRELASSVDWFIPHTLEERARELGFEVWPGDRR